MSLGLKKGLPGQKEEGSLEHNRAVVFVRGANKINKKPINPYPRSLWLFAPGGRQPVTIIYPSTSIVLHNASRDKPINVPNCINIHIPPTSIKSIVIPQMSPWGNTGRSPTDGSVALSVNPMSSDHARRKPYTHSDVFSQAPMSEVRAFLEHVVITVYQM